MRPVIQGVCAVLTMAMLLLPVGAKAADGYFGKVWMGDYQGRTVLVLHDETDNTALYFVGTPDFCEQRGDSYATFRNAINNTDANYRYYWTVEFCTGGTAYVCLDVFDQEEAFRPQACSTWLTDGEWEEWIFGDGM
jgi:hypothetical protein